ncbi:hypothetical protein PHSC3_001851 [Chlamydiales bacterium STE3]|nr:hypothetical protein PHSC3_001851 [Chlamydiales bacterium STE3]
MNSKFSFFDLDHTLLKVNISFSFGKYLFQKGKFPRFQVLYCAAQYFRHKFLGLSLSALHEKIFQAYFVGKSVHEMAGFVEDFLNKELNHFLYLPAFLEMQKAILNHEQVILLSSSPDFLVAPIAKRFGISYHATEYKNDDKNHFSSVANVLSGEVKAEIVKKLALDQSIATKNITAYSDSYLDLPFLKMAGRPVAVNPDRALLKVCQQNSWPIL